MALIDDIKTLCDRLDPLGWRDLLLQASHGALDIRQSTTADLQAALSADIPQVDRTIPGFTDFCPIVPARGTSASSLAQSLLYHALASPLLHPLTGAPASSYATLEELDLVENYVYSLTAFNLATFVAENPNARIAVFAVQYRTGGRTAHRRYADLTWSRTGVARTGVLPPIFQAERRSWRPSPIGDSNIAAMPARYSAWLTVQRSAGLSDVILEGTQAQRNRQSLWPVRKIFAGEECFTDLNVTLDYLEFHITEKLRSIHTEGGISIDSSFDLNAPPFVRTSETDPGIITLQNVGASVVVNPRHGPLVSVARQGNEIARFTVPNISSSSRFGETSLFIPPPGNFRVAPEYVNIRHEFLGNNQEPRDLAGLSDPAFMTKIENGGYEAVHFTDNSCDGAVLARVRGIDNLIPSARQLPAFSLVTAPDFFPLVDQVEINRWVRPLGATHFRQGGPQPLSAGDTPASQDVSRPGTQQKAFPSDDLTMTTVAGTVVQQGVLNGEPLPFSSQDTSVSWLPDAASNVFAPGWDVSRSKKGNSAIYLSSRGLGSPFPEDAKLCAMLNSFWPAVAPDASQTFGTPPTGIPMLDTELGLHARHPASGGVAQHGWDGETGPFFETVANVKVVNSTIDARSDYVSNAIAGRIHFNGLDIVTTEELIGRMEALRLCIRNLPPANDLVSSARLLLVTAEKVDDWSQRVDPLSPQLSGAGLLYVFAAAGAISPDPTDIRRKRQQIPSAGGHPFIYTCQIRLSGGKPDLLVWKQDGGTVNIAV